MKTSSACSLLTVLALLGGLPCALGQGGAEEPGAVTADKLQSCPYFNRSVCELVDPAPDKCQNDSQCPGSQRCCCVHCRQECAETVKRTPEKPGFCPVDLELEKRCGYVLRVNCSSDYDCGENEKCCLFGCGMQCVKALAEKPGTCPHADITCSEVFDEPQCQSDSDCPPTKRCCNKCGNKCLDAVQDHTGFCPTSPFLMLFVCVPNITKSSCSGDSQCQATEKCCSFNCKTQCTEASKEKWGACPKIGRNQTEVELLRDVCNKCNDDRDCPDVQKCCPGTEGRECIKPGNLFVRPAIDAGSSGAE